MVKLELVARKGFYLLASSIIDFRFVEELTFEGSILRLPFSVRVERGRVYRFEGFVDIPFDGFRWILKYGVNATGFLTLDGAPYYGVDSLHTFCIIPPGSHVLGFNLVPVDSLGVPLDTIDFRYVLLARVYWPGFVNGLRLLALYDYLRGLDGVLRGRILGELEELGGVRVPASLSQLGLAYMILYDYNYYPGVPRPDVPRQLFNVYYLANAYGVRAAKGVVVDSAKPSLDYVMEVSRRVESILSRFSKDEDDRILYPLAHSHVDVSWLWSEFEGRVKTVKTAATLVYVLDSYPDVVAGLSSAKLFEWIESEPQLYSRVREAVARGRLVPLGGMWVEGDLNIVDGESLARQLLYGQRYYVEKLGVKAVIGWLPDNFGYSANLPQLLLDAGLRVLVIQKLHWNDTSRPKGHFFKWKGLDGSVIPVQLIPSYDSPLTPRSVLEYTRAYDSWAVNGNLIMPFGFGDGGGGPNIEMLEVAELLNKLPGVPRISWDIRGYIERVTRADAPVVEGELYLELHRGTYTTNARVKELVSRGESSLRSAEIAMVIGEILGLTRYSNIAEAWRKLLTTQFHDVISGTAVREEYEVAYRTLEGVVEDSRRIVEGTLSGVGGGLIVYNDMPWRRSGLVEVKGEPGYRIPCQRSGGSVYLLLEDVPPLGFKVYGEKGECIEGYGSVSVEKVDDGVVLSNNLLHVKIGYDGLVYSMVDHTGFEYLGGPSGVLRVHVDEPPVWDAWDVEREALDYWYEMSLVEPVRVTVEGKLVSCVEYTMTWGYSKARQIMCLEHGARRLDFKTVMQWRDHGTMLKVWFKPSIAPSSVLFEAPFGVVSRSVEELSTTKFEAPAVRWVDVSDGVRGLAVISTSRHGYSYWRGMIGLSLIKKPQFPNPWTDDEVVVAEYSLYTHMGDYDTGGVYREALSRWSPLKVINSSGEAKLREFSLLEVKPENVVVSAIKKSEDGEGYIVRLFNPTNKTLNTIVKPNFKITKAYEVNITEDMVKRELEVKDNIVELELKPYKVTTIKLLP